MEQFQLNGIESIKDSSEVKKETGRLDNLKKDLRNNIEDNMKDRFESPIETKDSDSTINGESSQLRSKQGRSTRRNSRSLSSNSSRHNKKRRSSGSVARRKSSKKERSRNHRHSQKNKSRHHRSRSHSKNKDRKRSRYENNNHKSSKRRRDDSISSSDSEKSSHQRDYYRERRTARDRSRSNSALRVMKMKNLDNACGFYQRYYQRPHEDNDAKKSQLYWDGYQWVIKPNSSLQSDFDIIKPGRKIIISNLPLQINILADDLKEFLKNKIVEKNIVSSSELKNIDNIISGIEFNYEKNLAIITLISIKFAKRMALLDGTTLLGHTLRFSLYQDIAARDEVSCTNISKASALANSAQLSAKSAALAFAAFQNFTKDENITMNLHANISDISSKVVKIFGLIDSNCEVKKKKLQDLHEDMVEELKKYGKIVNSLVITPEAAKIGAETGSVFIQFQTNRSAEFCMKGIKGRRYEGKALKMAYIPEEAFVNDILPVSNNS